MLCRSRGVNTRAARVLIAALQVCTTRSWVYLEPFSLANAVYIYIHICIYIDLNIIYIYQYEFVHGGADPGGDAGSDGQAGPLL